MTDYTPKAKRRIDYGLLPDDSDKYLTGPDTRRDTGKSAPHTHRVRLVVTGTKTMPPTTTQSQGKTDSAGTMEPAIKTARRLLVTDVDPGLTTIKESL